VEYKVRYILRRDIVDKKNLVKFLDDLFKKYSFKRKGNQWILESGSFVKIIKLVRSRYGNNYYIDYGYILKNMELDQLDMHISNTLSSLDDKENKRIQELLDFDVEINDEKRKEELEQKILKKIILKFNDVQSEEDILNELKNRRNLNDISLRVKHYFKI
jgi:hypothetical protein